jgi:hypothetical protein
MARTKIIAGGGDTQFILRDTPRSYQNISSGFSPIRVILSLIRLPDRV